MSKKIIVKSCEECYESDFECRLGGPHCDRFLFFISLQDGEKIDHRCKLDCDETGPNVIVRRPRKKPPVYEGDLPVDIYVNIDYVDKQTGSVQATIERTGVNQSQYRLQLGTKGIR